MPLMVNPSTGLLLVAAAAESVSTTLPSSTMRSSASVASSASSTLVSHSASAAVNMTQVVAQEAADQLAQDAVIPRNLLLALGGLLILCMLLAHPRFLARLFASLPSAKRSKDQTDDYVFNMANAQGGNNDAQRRVGGGGLFSGWFLRDGRVRLQHVQRVDEKHNPFATPFDDAITPASTSFRRPTLLPPPHITPLVHNLPFSSTLHFSPFASLPSPFSSSVTLARLYLVAAYFVLVIIALVWQSDLSPTTKTKGEGADYLRSGLVALAQIPVVVALGVKGNLLGLCAGLGYERMKAFHKIVGRVIFFAATLHVALFLHKFVAAGTFAATISKPFVICGLIAYCSICLLAVSSLPWIRNACYGVFRVCHVIGIIGLLAGLAFHVDMAVPYCVSALCIYLLSIVSSLTKSRLAHAELLAIPDSRTTIVTIPTIRAGWRAGQHVRLRIPALGFSKGFQSHPFTIASAPDTEGLVLLCKDAGDWTKALFELAEGGTRGEGGRCAMTATVLVEGPYGGMGNTIISSFSSVLLVAGGSGISHALALAHDLVTRAPTGSVRARTVDLVWLVRTEDDARAVIPTLSEMVNDARAHERSCMTNQRNGSVRPTALRVTVFVTRCPVSSPIQLLTDDPFRHEDDDADGSDDILADRRGGVGAGGLKRQPSDAEKFKASYLARNPSSASTTSQFSIKSREPISSIAILPGKPDFVNSVNSLVDETITSHIRSSVDPSGICVTACGPKRLVHSVKEGVRKVKGYKVRAVGGVEMEEEYFGF